MGALVDNVVREVAEYGFDADITSVLRELDRRHKQMVERAQLRQQALTIGQTVRGQQEYVLPDDVIDVLEVSVAGMPFGVAPRSAELAYRRGALRWSPSATGLFVASASSAGEPTIGLIPPPDQDGLSIDVFAATQAETLGQLSTLLIPDQYTNVLVEGVAATFLRRDSEQRQSAADAEAIFAAGCEELRRLTARRVRGGGPARIRVVR